MSAVFITATGTDIGKTFVAAGLIRHFRAQGRPVEAIKPVVSGFDPNATALSDAGVLLTALDRPATRVAIEQISPWRFAAPLSPDMAARRERRAIDFGALVDMTRDAVNRANGLVLVEGIGGVMVPLDETHTVLDWMAALDIAVVLVTGSYLGSLSHTLTALDALRARKLVVKALVINETPGSTVPVAETVDTLSHFAAAGSIATLSREPANNSREFAALAALLER